MAIYLPCRMRDLAHYGFSGFEGRFYSLFPDLAETFAQAVNLQTLICALAYAWVQGGRIDHTHIPDPIMQELCRINRRIDELAQG